MVNAGGSIYAASRATADLFLRVVWEGGGLNHEIALPFSSLPWQIVPPVAGEGVPSLNNIAARAFRVPRLCGVPEVGHTPVGGRLAIHGMERSEEVGQCVRDSNIPWKTSLRGR